MSENTRTVVKRLALGGLAAAAALLLSACGTPGEAARTAADSDILLSLSNEGTAPLRCTILFGHWVEQEAGRMAGGEGLRLQMRRQATDGALYVPRYDGRRMYVENLICGPLSDWWERRADIPLVPLREGGSDIYQTTCRMAERAHCSVPAPL